MTVLAPLIGLCGAAGSGKDATCRLAMSLRPGRIARFALADDLKLQLATACGVSVAYLEDHKSLFRATLQAFGALRRELNGSGYWVDRIAGPVDLARRTGVGAIVTDIRYDSEVRWLREHHGLLVRVVRPHFGKIAPDHPSETEQQGFQPDFTLEACNLVELKTQLEPLLPKLGL